MSRVFQAAIVATFTESYEGCKDIANSVNMQEVQDNKPLPSAGLRERKRADTHSRIPAEAMRLFIERGFEATHLADLAEAAILSRPTLFHPLPSKQQLFLSHPDAFPEA